MSDTYKPWAGHTHVVVHHPKGGRDDPWIDDPWRGPTQILLHTGEYVWVFGSYSYEGHPAVRRVGDARCNGYSEDGCCILSVPAKWCKYYTSEEADTITMLQAADEELLSYARG